MAVNERRLRLLAVTHRFDARGYRCSGCDALWDAVIEGDARGEAGEVFYITRVDGSTLRVAKRASF